MYSAVMLSGGKLNVGIFEGYDIAVMLQMFYRVLQYLDKARILSSEVLLLFGMRHCKYLYKFRL
jgi:hypothetical protein